MKNFQLKEKKYEILQKKSNEKRNLMGNISTIFLARKFFYLFFWYFFKLVNSFDSSFSLNLNFQLYSLNKRKEKNNNSKELNNVSYFVKNFTQNPLKVIQKHQVCDSFQFDVPSTSGQKSNKIILSKYAFCNKFKKIPKYKFENSLNGDKVSTNYKTINMEVLIVDQSQCIISVTCDAKVDLSVHSENVKSEKMEILPQKPMNLQTKRLHNLEFYNYLYDFKIKPKDNSVDVGYTSFPTSKPTDKKLMNYNKKSSQDKLSNINMRSKIKIDEKSENEKNLKQLTKLPSNSENKLFKSRPDFHSYSGKESDYQSVQGIFPYIFTKSLILPANLIIKEPNPKTDFKIKNKIQAPFVEPILSKKPSNPSLYPFGNIKDPPMTFKLSEKSLSKESPRKSPIIYKSVNKIQPDDIQTFDVFNQRITTRVSPEQRILPNFSNFVASSKAFPVEISTNMSVSKLYENKIVLNITKEPGAYFFISVPKNGILNLKVQGKTKSMLSKSNGPFSNLHQKASQYHTDNYSAINIISNLKLVNSTFGEGFIARKNNVENKSQTSISPYGVKTDERPTVLSKMPQVFKEKHKKKSILQRNIKSKSSASISLSRLEMKRENKKVGLDDGMTGKMTLTKQIKKENYLDSQSKSENGKISNTLSAKPLMPLIVNVKSKSVKSFSTDKNQPITTLRNKIMIAQHIVENSENKSSFKRLKKKKLITSRYVVDSETKDLLAVSSNEPSRIKIDFNPSIDNSETLKRGALNIKLMIEENFGIMDNDSITNSKIIQSLYSPTSSILITMPDSSSKLVEKHGKLSFRLVSKDESYTTTAFPSSCSSVRTSKNEMFDSTIVDEKETSLNSKDHVGVSSFSLNKKYFSYEKILRPSQGLVLDQLSLPSKVSNRMKSENFGSQFLFKLKSNKTYSIPSNDGSKSFQENEDLDFLPKTDLTVNTIPFINSNKYLKRSGLKYFFVEDFNQRNKYDKSCLTVVTPTRSSRLTYDSVNIEPGRAKNLFPGLYHYSYEDFFTPICQGSWEISEMTGEVVCRPSKREKDTQGTYSAILSKVFSSKTIDEMSNCKKQ